MVDMITGRAPAPHRAESQLSRVWRRYTDARAICPRPPRGDPVRADFGFYVFDAAMNQIGSNDRNNLWHNPYFKVGSAESTGSETVDEWRHHTGILRAADSPGEVRQPSVDGGWDYRLPPNAAFVSLRFRVCYGACALALLCWRPCCHGVPGWGMPSAAPYMDHHPSPPVSVAMPSQHLQATVMPKAPPGSPSHE